MRGNASSARARAALAEMTQKIVLYSGAQCDKIFERCIMRFAIVKNAAELGERAFYEIKCVLKAKPDAVIGFATGRTPLPLYEKMAADHAKNGTSYKKVTAINLDEYIGVEAKDKNSFARFMKDNLFSKIDIDPANTNIPNGMAEDLEAECARYAKFVAEHPADIQILGIGANGHIAFNEPYTKYDTVTHIALLTAKTRSDNAEGFGNPALVPSYALTMGIKEILSAKKILMLASGEGKAEAIYNMLQGRDDTSCPAAALRKHPDVTVVLDEAAAKYLSFDEWEKVSRTEPAPVAAPPVKKEEPASEPVAEPEEETVEERPAAEAEEEVSADDKAEEKEPEKSDGTESVPDGEGAAEEEKEYLEAEIIDDEEEKDYLEAEIITDEEESSEEPAPMQKSKKKRKKK